MKGRVAILFLLTLVLTSCRHGPLIPIREPVTSSPHAPTLTARLKGLGPTPPVISTNNIRTNHVVVFIPPNPIAKFKFTWKYVLHANSYEVWTNSDLTQPFMLWTNVGWTTNLTWSIARSNMPPSMFFKVRGLVYNTNYYKSAILTWNAPTNSQYNGFKLYDSTNSGVYGPTNEWYATTNTTYCWPTNLISGLTYFFVATSYATNTDGSTNESAYSNEASLPVPMIETNCRWTTATMQQTQ